MTDTCKEYEHAASDIRGEICRLHKQVEDLCHERDGLSKKLNREQNETERLGLLLEEFQHKAKLDVGELCLEMKHHHLRLSMNI